MKKTYQLYDDVGVDGRRRELAHDVVAPFNITEIHSSRGSMTYEKEDLAPELEASITSQLDSIYNFKWRV